MLVRTILGEKGSDVHTLDSESRIADAVKTLSEKNIGAIVALDPRQRVCGILSERDVVRLICQTGPEALALSVGSCMTRDVVVCRLDDSIDRLMELMTRRRIRHLPVVENGELLGIVSIGDVVKWRIEETLQEAEALKSYIAT